MRVVVVGGGITGLSCAFALKERGIDVVVLEGASRIGGNIKTTREKGFVMDHGPDSWVSMKPHATKLAKTLGLGDQLIETIPANRRVYVMNDRGEKHELEPLPEGLMLGVPTQIWPMVKTPLLSWRGKIRAAFDLFKPYGYHKQVGEGGDESVAQFIERRVGREVLDRIAGPLLGGLFTGNVDDLSLQATFPQLIAMEEKGGLIRGGRAMAPKKKPGAPAGSPFTSLRGGVQGLVDALGERLREVVRLDTKVKRIARLPNGDTRGKYAVEIEGRDAEIADHVVLAGPARIAATLVEDLDSKLARDLATIPYGSSAVVFLAFNTSDVPRALDATGYLVPSSLGRAAAACTWVSSKWPGRAPEGQQLIRVFFGARHVDRDDANLVDLAREELRASIGVEVAPLLTHVSRFLEASPQPRVGHPARMKEIRAQLAAIGGLHVAGSAYDGVGMADCIRQAESIAEAIAAPGPQRAVEV